MDFAIPKEWENFLSNELKKEYVLSLKLRLEKEKALQKKIFPSEREIFKAFELTSPEKTKKMSQSSSSGSNSKGPKGYSHYTTLKVTVDPQTFVATVALDRAKKRNSITYELFQEIGQCFQQISRDPDVRCVVFTGGECKMFCSGIDLGYLQQSFASGGGGDDE